MTRRMLIDATQPEETRVAVVNGTKLEEYDYETLVRKQLKSNIYLVKVTRVEPSLQAAFVDFGGARHGFLPFPEIHPDYYRIPIADREALIAEERALAAAQAAREDAEDAAELAASGESVETPIEEDDQEEAGTGEESYAPRSAAAEGPSLAADLGQAVIVDTDEDQHEEEQPETAGTDADDEPETAAAPETGPEADPDVDTVGGDVVDTPVFRSSIKRRYKIQEVIKRNQIMLIQISKEERGNKGAAVTSYISLPGRYCVLMPNSPRGGGVSRKVSNAKDRQRLKQILKDLNVPEGMSVILRTAGVARATAEIKRDLDYLLRLWDEIRELTLKSTAPALVYEEGNLIKRAIRDLYRREIDEVLVAGEEGYKGALDFMKMLMPSHAKKVVQYQDPIPMFFRHQVETQIDAIHSPTVHLKSGGYIVINPTEAMVSIDVNSGRATKGRHIEETALKTNLEAAEEIARQLRLRDQGGLIVIDFIDMEDKRGDRVVEKRLRDAMQSDRARIQLGRISAFGLLELSRQRLHPSLVETNFETCKHCSGVGLTRTVETTAVMVLRAIEEEGMRGRAAEIKVSVPTEIALYVFNHKREMLLGIEKRYSLRVFINADDALMKPNYTIEVLRASGVQRDVRPQKLAPVQTVDMSDLPEMTEEEEREIEAVESLRRDDGIEGGGVTDADTGRSFNDRGDRGGRGGRHGRDRGRGRGDRGGDRGDRGGRGDFHARPPRSDFAPREAVAGVEGAPPGGSPAPEGGDTSENGMRRRGRRGGKRRGGRGRDGGGGDRPFRERGPNQQQGRPQGQDPAGSERADPASSERADPARSEQPRVYEPRPQQQASPAPANNGHREQAPRQDRPEPAAASYGGGGQDDSGGDKNRKGWWKRLTE